ncbi:BOI-related E3 ubiquitin-protein ligase 1-like [Wolffia australiana]
MAIQAPYPSHFLFLDRNDPEMKNPDYAFLEPPPLFFPSHSSHGGSSNGNRKRGREAAAHPAAASGPVTTLIDLSLLHSQPTAAPPHPAAVSTGLRLSFEDSSFLSSDLAAEIKNQKSELDQLIQTQAENLRRALAQARRDQFQTLLAAAEQAAARRLREKDAEMGRAARRQAELERRVAALRAEAVAWQAKARSEEAAAAALQAQLQNLASAGDGSGGAAGDDAESGYVDPDRQGGDGLKLCRACRRNTAAVLVLPCRHLCLCKDCAGVEACPVCLCARTACLEVFLS